MSTGSTLTWPSTMSTRVTVQSSLVYGSLAENGFSFEASWPRMPPPSIPTRPLLILPGPIATRTFPFAPAAICRGEAPLAWSFTSTLVGGTSWGSTPSAAARPARTSFNEASTLRSAAPSPAGTSLTVPPKEPS